MRRALLLLGVAIVSTTPVAFCDEGRPAVRALETGRRLVITCCACDATALAEVARLLLVELTGEGFVSVTVQDDALVRDATAVQARICERPSAAIDPVATFDVEVRDPAAGITAHRLIAVQPAEPAVRARVLAVELAELLRASWLEPAVATRPDETADPPPVVAAPPVVSTAVIRPARPPANGTEPPSLVPANASTQVQARFGGRSFAPSPVAVWGGGLGVRVPMPIRLPLALSGSILSLAGEADDSLGSVRFGEVTAGIGAGLVLRVSPRITVALELGLDAGLAWASGHPQPDVWAEGLSVQDFVVSAGAAASVALLLAGPLEAVVTLEAGRVLRGLRATSSGTLVAAIDGLYVGGSLGLGLRLGSGARPGDRRQ